MLAQINAFSKILNSRSVFVLSRNFHLSSSNLIKEIVETKADNHLIIEGVIKPSPRESHLIKLPEVEDKDCCSLCRLGLDIKHTDILIVSQFVRQDGLMLPRRVTKLCGKQQRRMSALVTMARKAGLLTKLGPSISMKEPKPHKNEKKFNNYWDESLIPYK